MRRRWPISSLPRDLGEAALEETALGFGADLVDCRLVRFCRLGGPVKTAEQVRADGGQQAVILPGEL